MNFRNLKRRTARRNTSTNRHRISDSSLDYGRFEARLALATFVVTTELDIVDPNDGQLSLREAVTAANTNAAFSDALAGDATGDRIVFSDAFEDVDKTTFVTDGELEITDDLVIRGRLTETTIDGEVFVAPNIIDSNRSSRIFNINTSETVRLHQVGLQFGSADRGGLVYAQSGSDLVIFGSTLKGGFAELGGGVYVDSASVRINSSTFQSNGQPVLEEIRAASGGAIHAVDSDVTVIGGEFLNNAADQGGAIAIAGGQARLSGSSFGELGGGGSGSEASAFRGGNEAFTGGAIHVAEASLTTNSDFVDNKATCAESLACKTTETMPFAKEQGGAIYSFNSDVTVYGGNYLANSAFTAGGAISVNGGNLGLYSANFGNSQVANLNGGNSARFGGAVSTFDTYTVSNASFVGNFTLPDGFSRGGAIDSIGNTLHILPGSEFIGNGTENSPDVSNAKTRRGGAITSQNEALYIADAVFRSNYADSGGAIVSSSETAVINGVTIEGNSASSHGGGLVSGTGATTFISGSTIRSNRVANPDTNPINLGVGGGIFAAGNSKLVLRQVNLSSNSAVASGGAIESNAELFVYGSTLGLNTVSQGNGGAINNFGQLIVAGSDFVNNSANESEGIGGAIYNRNEATSLIYQSNFSSNSANVGGAIGVAGGYVRVAQSQLGLNGAQFGGAAFVGEGTLVVVGGELDSNTADLGGAVRVDSGGRFVARSNARFSNNTADFGGAIHSNGLINLESTRFTSNTADAGGAIHLAQGALAFINSSFFKENSTGTGNGTAILSQGSEVLSILDSTFEENFTEDNPNGFPIFGERFNFFRESGLTFINNTPNDGVGTLE